MNIETRYRGASSDVVESRITQIIENEISGIEGVERLNSASRDERSQINVEFSLERDLDSAANDVRERLSRVAARLPLEADPPQITKVDSGTDPIIWLNVDEHASATCWNSPITCRVISWTSSRRSKAWRTCA